MRAVISAFVSTFLLLSSAAQGAGAPWQRGQASERTGKVTSLLDGLKIGPCKFKVEGGAGITVTLEASGSSFYSIFLHDDLFREKGNTLVLDSRWVKDMARYERLTITKDANGQVSRVRLQKWANGPLFFWDLLRDGDCRR